MRAAPTHAAEAAAPNKGMPPDECEVHDVYVPRTRAMPE